MFPISEDFQIKFIPVLAAYLIHPKHYEVSCACHYASQKCTDF